MAYHSIFQIQKSRLQQHEIRKTAKAQAEEGEVFRASDSELLQRKARQKQ